MPDPANPERSTAWVRITLFFIVLMLLVGGGWWYFTRKPATTSTVATTETIAPKPAKAVKPAPAAKKEVTPAATSKKPAPTAEKTKAAQVTTVIIGSPGVAVPTAPCTGQCTTVIVDSAPVESTTPPVPAPTPPPPAAVPQKPAAATTPFEIIVSLVSWSEAVRPAIANGRVDGRMIGHAMNAGQATRFGEEVDLDIVKSDGQILRTRTKLGQRGALAVNEAVITMPRSEAVNFGISNIVPKSGWFITPSDRFSEIAASVARGSRGIIFFLVTAPPGSARSAPPPLPPPSAVPPQS